MCQLILTKSDGSRLFIYVLSPKRLSGRLQSMVQADNSFVFNCFYADNAFVSRTFDLSRKYAPGTRHHACVQWSAEDCAAVRPGLLCQSEHDECRSRDYHSGEPNPKRGKSSRKIKGTFRKVFQTHLILFRYADIIKWEVMVRWLLTIC